MENLKIFVACHKPFEMIVDDSCFQPIHVGSQLSKVKISGSIADNTGDNISVKNPTYCELTGLYWVWKNYRDAKYLGLCHYRRFFAKSKYNLRKDYGVLHEADFLSALKNNDVIMPTPVKKLGHLNHYYDNDADYEKDRMYIEITKAMEEVCPEYLQAAKDVLKAPYMSFGNIMVTDSNTFFSYCEWLFKVEDYLEKFIDQKLGGVEPREYGFISEWLLNIWVKHNNLKVKYYPVVQIRDENIVMRLLRNAKQLLKI